MTDQDRGPAFTGRYVPPPATYIVALAAAFLAHWRWPVHIAEGETAAVVRLAGIALVTLGIAIMASGAFTFWRHRTNVLPYQPSVTVVTGGPFRVTRNPMYLGMATVYLGITLWGNSWWPVPLLPVVLLAVQKLAIEREEQYLEAKFGDAYRAYKARVRRWL